MKNSNPLVALVVVTYNRSALLKKLLESIRNLQYKNIEVVIVNNCSTDDTASVLQAYSENPTYHIVNSKKNVGGAGGFKLGMEYAQTQTTADWQLLVDDDVVLLPDAIDKLLKYSDISQCIHGSKMKIDGTRFDWEGHYDTTSGWLTWYRDRFVAHKPYTFVNYACFEGMFISRELVEKVGYPDDRYFIWMDDHMYGLVASKFTNILYSTDYTLQKTLPVGLPGPKAIQPYFQIRNYFLMWPTIKQHFPEAKPYLYFSLWSLVFTRKLILSILSLNFFRIKLLLKGVRDGLSKKFGSPYE